MSEILPFQPSISHYEFSTGFVGDEFVFNVRWNGRAESWFIDILARDRTHIASGLKLVLGTLIGGRSTDPRFPQGVFQVIDLSGDFRDAGFDDLGTRVIVYFYSNTELGIV